MAQAKWMIYGANGFTGELLAERAVAEGLRPILSGRTEATVKPIAERLGLSYRIVSLDQTQRLQSALNDMALVVHCAGPFSATSEPMVDACLATKTHYLDITGEIDIFEAIQQRNDAAISAGVSLIPGVGFDVVPSDCLAASLNEVFKTKGLGDADHLELAFHGSGATSPGTAKTMVQMLGDGGRIRSAGKVIKVSTAYKQKSIVFEDKTLWCMTIPWGDVSTAFHSTQIPNVMVFTAVPRGAALVAGLFSPFMGLMKLASVQNFLNAKIEKSVKGPDEQTRKEGHMSLWARIENKDGEGVEGTLRIPEGYQFTIVSALASAKKVLAGGVQLGAVTPSKAFGANFVTQLEGVSAINISGDAMSSNSSQPTVE